MADKEDSDYLLKVHLQKKIEFYRSIVKWNLFQFWNGTFIKEKTIEYSTYHPISQQKKDLKKRPNSLERHWAGL